MTHGKDATGPGGPGPLVLLVSDHDRTRDSVRSALSPVFRVEHCGSDVAALRLVDSRRPDCLLVDMQLPGDDTLALLRAMKRCSRDLPVMLLCSAAQISTAVEGIRAGAADFVIKEVEIGSLAERISRVTGRPARAPEAAPCPPSPAAAWMPWQMVVGTSRRVLEVMKVARRAACHPVPILLLGESGTGKGLLANWIHRMSRRAGGPFVAVNLAAIPPDLVESTLFGHERGAFTGATCQREGKFQAARDGTLLLDEIAEFRTELQPKLLRVLQEGEFERVGGQRTLHNGSRIISATNRDIHDLVRQGRFRSDLFYRLKVITITMPPLRERREDIPDLVGLFLAKYSRLYESPIRGVSPEGMELLMDHGWPGNIRELEHVIQRAVVVADGEYAGVRDLFDFESSGRDSLTGQMADRCGTLEDLERRYIEEILQRTNGHQGQAAKLLGIDRKTIYNKIVKYGLKRPPGSQDDRDDGISWEEDAIVKRSTSA